jgi:hypothetical protein
MHANAMEFTHKKKFENVEQATPTLHKIFIEFYIEKAQIVNEDTNKVYVTLTREFAIE